MSATVSITEDPLDLSGPTRRGIGDIVDQAVLGTAVARIALGVLTLAAPTVLARGFGVDRGSAERTAVVARMFAARELGLGIGSLYALLPTGAAAQPAGARRGWLVASVLADSGDALACALAFRSGNGGRLRLAGATAVAAGAAAGAAAALLGAGRTAAP